MASKRLSQRELQDLFLTDLGAWAEKVENNGRKPLMLRLKYPFNRKLKIYLFNCTAPPGGRSIDEFKVQLILDGQRRGERGKIDTSDGRTTLIVGYATPFIDVYGGIWVLFELDKHKEFAYSANIQVYLRQILPALEETIHVCQKNNKEILVIAQRQYLRDAIQERFNIDLQIMLERAKHGATET